VPANADLPIPNHFLASLPPDDYEFLRPHLEPLDLPLRMILHETGQPIDYCYFTDGGMTSLLVQLEDGALIEAGLVGKEGFAGLSALLGGPDGPAPHTSMIQMPGRGVRVPAGVLREAMRRSPTFLDLALRLTQALAVQTAQTAVCNARHDLQERLARWLPLTQEFISMMLAVRRPGVTVAARSLQVTGAIDYQRGRVLVRDRERLEEASCECYAVVREQYQRLLGWPSE